MTVTNSAPGSPEDGDDDLAALDFGVEPPPAENDLGVILGGYGDAAESQDGTPAELSILGRVEPDEPDDGTPTFTVTNPPGTVTVTTYLDGRVAHVDLSPQAAAMSETGLADEIVVIAGLATQDARSAQYTFMVDGMRE